MEAKQRSNQGKVLSSTSMNHQNNNDTVSIDNPTILMRGHSDSTASTTSKENDDTTRLLFSDDTFAQNSNNTDNKSNNNKSAEVLIHDNNNNNDCIEITAGKFGNTSVKTKQLRIAAVEENNSNNLNNNLNGINDDNKADPASDCPKQRGRRWKRRERRSTKIDIIEYMEASSTSPTDDMDQPWRTTNAAKDSRYYDHRSSNNNNSTSTQDQITTVISAWYDLIHEIQNIHYFWTSPMFLQIYLVVGVAIVVRRLWILQLIPILILGRMIRLCVNWGLFVWDAPNLKRLKALILWWTKFGLDFASKTVEGRTVHQFVATMNFHFWKGIGKDMTLGTIKQIGAANKAKVIDMNKELIRRANENRQRISVSLPSSLQPK